ncbi:MAG: hypothetical protein D6715_02755 [Calditrichaeota bacterium]|nr:MAG: hypothetical protein D6715_02755 [Calditrichota bacterium]
MNQKTAKLLHRYASHSGQNVKELKKWWLSLNHMERARERQRMLEELGQETSEAAESEENAQ